MSALAVWKSNKKTLRFVVTFHLEELSSVPFLAGVIFAKLRLLQGGHFTKISDREEIVEHRVCWNSTFTFEAKLTATLSTGILDPCTVRVSVRREAQGGKSHLKLGFADINLAEFAGGTPQSRSFLLEEYNSSARANNALLRVTIHMQVKEGDFCFKVPVASSVPSYFGESLSSVVVKDGDEEERGLVDGGSDPPVVVPSSASQSSMPPHQTEHSRQSSSSDSGVVREMGSEYGSLERNSGRNSALSGPSTGLLEREKTTSSRVDATRVDPEGLIDQLLRESNLASSPHEVESSSLVVQGAVHGPGDVLTCGGCAKQFSLSDIVRFIQHKVRTCPALRAGGVGGEEAAATAAAAAAALLNNNNLVDEKGGHNGEDEDCCFSATEDDDGDADTAFQRLNESLNRTASGGGGASNALKPSMSTTPRRYAPTAPTSAATTTKTCDASTNTTTAIPAASAPEPVGCVRCGLPCPSAWALILHVQSHHGLPIAAPTTLPPSSPKRKPVPPPPPQPVTPTAPPPPPPLPPPPAPPNRLEVPNFPGLLRFPFPQPFCLPRPPMSGNPSTSHELVPTSSSPLHSPHLFPPLPPSPFDFRSTSTPNHEPLDFYSQRLRQLAGGASPKTTTTSSPSSSPTDKRACDVCGKRFRFESTLVAHRRTHASDPPHRCLHCGQTFTSSGRLRRHLLSQHPSAEDSSATTTSPSSSTPTPPTSGVGSSGGIHTTSSGPNSSSSSHLDLGFESNTETKKRREGPTVASLTSSDDERRGEDDEDEDFEEGEDECMEEEEEEEEEENDPFSSSKGPQDLTRPRRPSSSTKENSGKGGERNSLVGELIDRFGLNNIAQYSEAYRQALKESQLYSKLKAPSPFDLIPAPPLFPPFDGGLHHLSPTPPRPPSGGDKRGLSKEDHAPPPPPPPPHPLALFPGGLWGNPHHPPHHPALPAFLGGGPPTPNNTQQQQQSPQEPQNDRDCESRKVKKEGGLRGGGGSDTPLLKKESRRNDTCEFCGKVFKNCSNLTVHRRSHTGEKPYKCELCNYACAQSSKLTRHMKTHGRLGKDVYRCRFCEMPFSVPSTLEKHMRKCVVNQNNLAAAAVAASVKLELGSQQNSLKLELGTQQNSYHSTTTTDDDTTL